MTVMEAVPATSLAIDTIEVKDHNGRHEQTGITELAASIRLLGLDNPITVRPRGKKFALVAGGRRLAAAKLLGWTEIRAKVRELTDDQAIALRIVENDQREDLHPLDQAASYMELSKLGHSVMAIAEMVSRPESHVYDRLRLGKLTPAAQKLLRAGRIGVEHAILISRQKPADQDRIVAPPGDSARLGLWRHEDGADDLFEDDEKKKDADPFAGYVARTAVELKDWIDHNIRFDRNAPDLPQLFEATAANMTAAVEKREKIIPITFEHHLQDGARDSKERTYGPQSFKRADGASAYDQHTGRTAKTKTCESSALGVVVAGERRGTTLRICVDKNCAVHWKDEATESKKRKKAAASGNTERAATLERQRRERDAREHQRVEAERARWKKAAPAIVKALATAIAKADAKPSGYLAKVLMHNARSYDNRVFEKTLAPGASAETLVRWLAFMTLVEDASSSYRGPEEFPAIAKALKIDVAKVLDEAAPVKPAAAEPAAKGKGARGRAKKRK